MVTKQVYMDENFEMTNDEDAPFLLITETDEEGKVVSEDLYNKSDEDSQLNNNI